MFDKIRNFGIVAHLYITFTMRMVDENHKLTNEGHYVVALNPALSSFMYSIPVIYKLPKPNPLETHIMSITSTVTFLFKIP